MLFRSQDSHEGSIWRKRGEADGIIDWRMSSRGMYNLVRALSYSYIGAQFEWKESKIRAWRVEEIFDINLKKLSPEKL